MKNWSFLICILLSVCIILSSCLGINRGEGYVFLWSEDTNYVVITISNTEYIHFLMDSGVGEWVTATNRSPITIDSVYYPVKNANAYRLVRYSSEKDAELAKLFLGFNIPTDIYSESFFLTNPDREKGVIHIMNESTKDVIYASKVETSYKENITFSITSSGWKDFLAYDDETRYQSLEHSFWYCPHTNEGQWNINGKIIPIEIELLQHGPGIAIFDTSNGDKKEILRASGTLSNSNTLILDYIHGNMFYDNSINSLTLTKTT